MFFVHTRGFRGEKKGKRKWTYLPGVGYRKGKRAKRNFR